MSRFACLFAVALVAALGFAPTTSGVFGPAQAWAGSAKDASSGETSSGASAKGAKSKSARSSKNRSETSGSGRAKAEKGAVAKGDDKGVGKSGKKASEKSKSGAKSKDKKNKGKGRKPGSGKPPVRVDGPIRAPVEDEAGAGEATETVGDTGSDSDAPAKVDPSVPGSPDSLVTDVVVKTSQDVKPTKAEIEARRAARLERLLSLEEKIEAEKAAPAPQARREPAAAATAPRIALSSGDGAPSYRQYEITALGITPRARQVVGALGFQIISERRSALLGGRTVAKLRTPRHQTAEGALKRVRSALPEVTFDYAHLYRPSGGAMASVSYPVDMVGAHVPATCSVDAAIGLIDTGVGAHPSLAGSRITRRSFVDQAAARNVAHGTAIASILVGDLPGTEPLAPGAEIYAADVFVQDGPNLRADALAIIEALDWMAAQRVRVVNLSLMGPSNALLEAAVRASAERGQILVAAAGNEGPAADPAYPAAYPSVIAVAAVDQRGRPYGRGNRGSYVYVAAPGVDVWGADARGGEAFWTGTSFAAPFVTATLARDLAQGRASNINDGRARIAASARDMGAPGRDPIYGHGLLQVGGCSGGPSAVMSSRN